MAFYETCFQGCIRLERIDDQIVQRYCTIRGWLSLLREFKVRGDGHVKMCFTRKQINRGGHVPAYQKETADHKTYERLRLRLVTCLGARVSTTSSPSTCTAILTKDLHLQYVGSKVAHSGLE